MASYYALIVACDPLRGEHTNIGVIAFDGEGRYHAHRLAKLARAIRRGDYPADADEHRISCLAESIKSLEVLERLHDSIGHCMSCVQVLTPCGSLLAPEETLRSAWEKLIVED